MEEPRRVFTWDIPGKLCQCTECGFTAVCTTQHDFLAGKSPPDGGSLVCQKCICTVRMDPAVVAERPRRSWFHLGQSAPAPTAQVFLWLVVIQDKETIGEADIGFCVVADPDTDAGERRAHSIAREMERHMADRGRGRCVSRVRPISPDVHYKLLALFNASGWS